MLMKRSECFRLNLHFISVDARAGRTQIAHWLNRRSLSVYFLPVSHVAQGVPTRPCVGVGSEKLVIPMPLLFTEHGVHFSRSGSCFGSH